MRAFEQARQAEFPCVPHAGETVGPESIWAALRRLHADRLGHGIRCAEDPALVEHLRERQIPLEVCPTSNIRLGVYPDYAAHPLRQLWDAGLLVTVSSDDPPMFGANLNHEYEVLVDHFGFSADELEQVSLNGLHTSFLSRSGRDAGPYGTPPQADKARLESEFRAGFAQLREDVDEEKISLAQQSASLP